MSLGNYTFYECTSLQRVTLPTSIGNDTFSECTSLKSVTISRAVTQLDVSDECSSNSRRLYVEAVREMTTQNMESWSKTKDENCRVPLMTSAAISLDWKYMEKIFNLNRTAIYDTDDAVTGLPVSLLAAVGPNSNLESVYRLCKEYPPVLMQTSLHSPLHNKRCEKKRKRKCDNQI